MAASDGFSMLPNASERFRCLPMPSAGTLERHELLQQPHGLVASVRTLFPPPGSHGPIPEMRTDKSAWYDFFDEDRSGSLEQEEVVRALIKTLGLSTDQVRRRTGRLRGNGDCAGRRLAALPPAPRPRLTALRCPPLPSAALRRSPLAP